MSAAPVESVDWKHPDLQALLSKNARLSIELMLIESMLFERDFEMSGTDYDYETKRTERVYDYRLAVAKLVAVVKRGEVRPAETGEHFVVFGVAETTTLRAALAALAEFEVQS